MIAGKRAHDVAAGLTVAGVATALWLLAGAAGPPGARAAHLLVGLPWALLVVWQPARGFRRLWPRPRPTTAGRAQAFLGRVLLIDGLLLALTGGVLWALPGGDPLALRAWTTAHHAAHEVLLPTLVAHGGLALWQRRRRALAPPPPSG